MLLWNTGGDARASWQMIGMELAKRSQAPVAFLFHVPNQPIYGKKEDALIAETFLRFLQGGGKDESWPLLFAMVKSVVRAMDAVQAFAREEWKTPVEQFIVTGGSKRGWTSWLTAATGDPRVKAIAPMVIDTLNMKEQMDKQLRDFGAYSEQIKDYTEAKLVPLPDTDLARKLWGMIDPYTYREKLTVPKMIINGNNDPYWTTDALNLYWDGLPGEKHVLYVPNAAHDLRQKEKLNPADQLAVALNGLAAFARHQIKDNPMPKLTWKHDTDRGRMTLDVAASEAPKAARLWLARADTRDFRKARWDSTNMKPLANDKPGARAVVDPPEKGCVAFYAELEFEVDGIRHSLCTQIRVAGEPVKASRER
jgi:PhoPQ-activated pathogenicity-related protein